MRYFQFHSVQNLQVVVKIRRYVLNYKGVHLFSVICGGDIHLLTLYIPVANIWIFLSRIETELSFSSNLQMMTAYHNKSFLNIPHVVCLFFC